MKTAEKTLKRLYRDRSGYEDKPSEERMVMRRGSDALYGELLPSATAKLFRYLELTENDVLYDLGSGIGKVAIQAAITTRVKRVVGIEMMPSRHEIACDVLSEVEGCGMLTADVCELWQADFMRSRIPDATIIYTCSTAFPVDLIDRLADKVARLQNVRKFVTLQELEPTRRFRQTTVLRLDTSWKRRAMVYVYEPSSRAIKRRSIIATAAGE